MTAATAEALPRSATDLEDPHPTDPVLNEILARLRRVLQAAETGALIRDGEGHLEVVRHCTDGTASHVRWGAAALVRVAAGTANPIHLTAEPQTAGAPTRDLMVVPIRVGGSEPSAFYALSPPGRHFDQDAEANAAAWAPAIGAAVENRALRREARQREGIWRGSLDVLRQLLTGTDSEATLRFVVDQAREAVGARGVALMLPVGADELEVTAASGWRLDSWEGARIPWADSVSGEVIASRRARNYADISAHPIFGWRPQLAEIGPLLVVPLPAGSHLLGALCLVRPRGSQVFEDTDMEIGLTYAAHAALCLELSRRHQFQARLAMHADRERMALELHDLVIQRLFAAGLTMESLRPHLPGGLPTARLESIGVNLDLTINDVRSALLTLVDQVDDEVGRATN